MRILRVARFAARFGFASRPRRCELMRAMVRNGEVDTWCPSASGRSFARPDGAAPSRMFEALRACGALARMLPEVDALFGVPQPAAHHPEVDTGVHILLVLDCAASQGLPLPVRFAALTHDLGKGTTPPEEWPRHIAHEARGVELLEGSASACACRSSAVSSRCW